MILAFIFLGILTACVFIAMYPTKFINDPLLYIVPFLIIVALVSAIYLVIVQGENSRNKKRFQDLDRACQDINSKNLMGTGTSVNPGEDGAWLEIDLDPRRTMIEGGVVRDKSEDIIENYHSGFDATDEGIKELYVKKVPLHELDRSVEVSEVVI